MDQEGKTMTGEERVEETACSIISGCPHKSSTLFCIADTFNLNAASRPDQ